jgi:hypothetical protein
LKVNVATFWCRARAKIVEQETQIDEVVKDTSLILAEGEATGQG